ncbi:MAG: hypothetical protein C0502_04515 [Opitutus sp.]|nr:hypothetical protein [Opitutus sp.]
MISNRRRLAGGIFALLASLHLCASPPVPWMHERSDLPPDPEITFGALPNGLRYAVRSNAEPAGRVFLILRVQAGSVHERDDQRGFAHFVEHMAFNGTRRFPGSTLAETMQRSGYNLGAHLSAFTGYLSTFYQLDAPRNDEATLRQAFDVLGEFAQHVAFDAKEVKREFGVVESERRAHVSSPTDYGREIEAFLFRDTRFAARAILGDTAQLRRAKPEALREYYRTWYRPSRMTVIAVGDLPREKLVALITAQFSQLAEPATPPPPEPELGSFQYPDQIEARYIATHQPGGLSTLLYSVQPNMHPVDNTAARHAAVAKAAVNWMLHERLQSHVREQPELVGQAQAGFHDFFQAADVHFLRLDTQSGLWRRGITTLDEELRRALAYGFSDDEVEAQRVRFEAHYQEAIRSAPQTPSAALANMLLQSMEVGFVPTSPADTWRILQDRVRNLSAADCLAAVRAIWPGEARRFIVLGNQDAVTSEKDIAAVLADYRRLSVLDDKPAALDKTLAYTFAAIAPAPISHREFPEVDSHVVTFPNGVRLALKRTDYTPNRIELRARLGYGRATEPTAQAGIATAAATVLLPGGLGRHNEASLNRILAGESLRLQLHAEENAFVFHGEATRTSLATLLRLNAAYLLDPAFRPAPMYTAMSQLRSYYDSLASNPEAFVQACLPRIVHAGDHRYGLPFPQNVFRFGTEELRTWFEPIVRNAPLDISLAGDLDLEETITEIARTFGTLPQRETRTELTSSLRPRFNTRAAQENIQLPPGLHKSAIVVAWPYDVPRLVEDPRRVRMLTLALRLRLLQRVREELGATYSPVSDMTQSNAWPQLGYLYAAVQVEPKLAEKVSGLVRHIARDLATNGLTAGEFAQIHQPKVASLDTELRDNSYWLFYVLPNLGVTPWALDLPLSRTADYRSITTDELNAFARRHLRHDLATTVVVTSP